MSWKNYTMESERKTQMSKKLFLGLLAMTVASPVMVAPVQAQNVKVEISQEFKDVPRNYPTYTEIMAMRNQGIIGGYPDNTFRPSQAISRVHTAALFVRSLDLKPVREGKEFKDVPKSSPYYNDVQAVYRAGIFDGNPNGTFGVNDNLTRAQMAKVLVAAFDLPIKKGYIFSDIGANHWAKDDISTLYSHGITVGDNGMFKPNQSVSRAQYAVFLYRALNPDKAPKPSKPLSPNPPVVKPEPKPENKVKPNPPHSNNVPNITITGSVPGANKVSQIPGKIEYSFIKSLPGGGKITSVEMLGSTSGNFSVAIDGKDKNGGIIFAVKSKIDDKAHYVFSAPALTPEAFEQIEEWADMFLEVHEK